jgi:hypothetical protein
VTKVSPVKPIVESAMKSLVCGFIIVGFFTVSIVPVTLILNLDLMKYYIEFFKVSVFADDNILFTIVFRIGFQMLGWHSVLRSLLSGVLSTLILLLKVDCIVYSLKQRGKLMRSVKEYERLVHYFGRLRITMRIICSRFWLVMFFTLPFTLAIVEVFAIFCSVRFHKIVPLFLCVLALGLSAAMWLVISLLFYPTVYVYEGTRKFLIMWEETCAKNHLMRFTRRKWTKQLKAVRPVGIGAGMVGVEMFYFKKSTRSTYYWLLVNYTLNALISVPERFISLSFVGLC